VSKSAVTRTILLVEDNADDEALTLRAFTRAGIANRVDVVRDGAEAIEYLFREGVYAQRPAELPVLVLLDLKLPKIDGLEVLKRLHADRRTHLLRVVILTSSREERDLVGGYSAGAASYIVKPVDFEQFVNAARQVGLYWLLLNEPPPP
jgi:two-component system response regulator